MKYFQAKLFSRVVGVGLLMNCLMNRENYGVDFSQVFWLEIKVLIIRFISLERKSLEVYQKMTHILIIVVWGERLRNIRVEVGFCHFVSFLKKTWHHFSFQYWLTFFLSIFLHNHIMLNYTITYSWVIYLYSSNIWMTIVLWTLASNCARWRSLLKKTNHPHCHYVQYRLPINKMTSKMTRLTWWHSWRAW